MQTYTMCPYSLLVSPKKYKPNSLHTMFRRMWPSKTILCLRLLAHKNYCRAVNSNNFCWCNFSFTIRGWWTRFHVVKKIQDVNNSFFQQWLQPSVENPFPIISQPGCPSYSPLPFGSIRFFHHLGALEGNMGITARCWGQTWGADTLHHTLPMVYTETSGWPLLETEE